MHFTSLFYQISMPKGRVPAVLGQLCTHSVPAFGPLLCQMAHKFLCVPVITTQSIRPCNPSPIVRRILRMEGKVYGHSSTINDDNPSELPRTSDCQIPFIIRTWKRVDIEDIPASNSNEVYVEASVSAEIAPQVEPVALGHFLALEMCEKAVMSLRRGGPIVHAWPGHAICQTPCGS